MSTPATINPPILGLLIDLSGTLHIGQRPVDDRAVDALRRLRASGRYQIRFVSNTTKEATPVLVEQLNAMGFDVIERELLTSLTATCDALVALRIQRPLLLLEDAAAAYVREGLSTAPDSTASNGPGKDYDAVVVGLAPSLFTHERLSEAMRAVLDGAKLIAIHRGRRYAAAPDGRLLLGPGAFIAALEYATGREACATVGKPSAAFFQRALDDMNLPATSCLMIGDDALDDCAGAKRCGMRAWLVRTGKYRPGDERGRSSLASSGAACVGYEHVNDGVSDVADACLASFAECVDVLLAYSHGDE